MAVPFVYLAIGNLWKTPRSQEASATFQKTVAIGMPLAQIESKARELDADSFRVLEAVDAQGRVKKAIRVLWHWYPLGLWPARRICIIPLVDGRADTVTCRFEGI